MMMTSLLLRSLILGLLSFTTQDQAENGLTTYTDAFENKLSQLARFFPYSSSFVGTPGVEQTILVDVTSNGQIGSVVAQEPIIDKALAAEAQKLILMTSPFAPLPAPLATDFPMVRLHVTFVLKAQPGLFIKRVEAKGGYKYVAF